MLEQYRLLHHTAQLMNIYEISYDLLNMRPDLHSTYKERERVVGLGDCAMCMYLLTISLSFVISAFFCKSYAE